MQTRNDKLILVAVILGAIGIFLLGRDVQLFVQGKNLETQYEAVLKERKDVIEHNKQVQRADAKAIQKTNLKPLYDDGSKVIKDLFDWGSWDEYRANMKSLTKEFPVVARTKNVDSKGELSGIGNSPISSYRIDSYGVGSEPDQLSFYVTQKMKYPDKDYVKHWYLCFTRNDKGQLKMIGYYPMQQLGSDEDDE